MDVRRTFALAAIATVAAVPTLAGCEKYAEPGRDAPTGNRNEKPADVMSFPDGFSNLAVKCDGPNRVYVAYHGDKKYAAVAVAPNDPQCATGGH